MSRVAKIALIRREVRYSLSPSAVEALFGRAELVVEGSPELNGRGRGPRELYATVMVTLDLRRHADLFREPADEATAERVAELLGAADWVRERIIRLARPELARLAGQPLSVRDVALEPEIRVDGCRLLLDADAVVSLRRAAESP